MVATPLPLPTLLSQALVAFTVEFDNEFEHRIPHRTKDRLVRGGGPWLVSQAMWVNFMRFVRSDGTPLRELAVEARLTNLRGLQHWGYVKVEPDRADRRPRPPRGDSIVRPTTGGRVAQEVWRPLGPEIEGRWAERFGRAAVDHVRAALDAILARADVALPAYLPVLGYGLWTHLPAARRAMRRPGPSPTTRGPGTSRRRWPACCSCTPSTRSRGEALLAIGSNLVRVLDETGVPCATCRV